MVEMITLRPVEDGDRALLRRIYGSTREEELAPLGWDEAQRAAFVAMQFDAQDRYYREHYPAASFQVILRDGRPAGRLYVNQGAEEIRIVDIALLPEHRGAGIGTALLRELQALGAAQGKPVTIHVERFNPALRLYERLGFRPSADRGVYLLLAWSPGAPAASGEDRLVAHPPGVRAERDQEEVEGAERVVLQAVDALG
jgi:ribosomal protein S18 acetylase RimI-like enzyme